MAERMKTPWRAADGQTFGSRAEAEQYEARTALIDWVEATLQNAPGTMREIATTVVGSIEANPAQFIGLLRAAGIRIVERKPATKPRQRKNAVKVAVE